MKEREEDLVGETTTTTTIQTVRGSEAEEREMCLKGENQVRGGGDRAENRKWFYSSSDETV